MGELKYKVGDKVRIKDIDWYNENKSKSHGTVACSGKYFDYDMREWCGKTMTILEVYQTCYIMREDGAKDLWTDEMIDCLVERNGKTYPYKIGDRVVLKGNNRCATITDLKYNSFGNLSYYIKIDNDKDISTDCPTDLLLPYDNTIEGLVEEENNDCEGCCSLELKYNKLTIADNICTDKVEIILQDYELEKEGDKWFAVKKKKKYPKTYEECCRIVNANPYIRLMYDLSDGQKYSYDADNLRLYESIRKLLICRDAYWKIAGDEMGLGKPWRPDWDNLSTNHEFIKINKGCFTYSSRVLVFPTDEMRYAFKENFDPDIEICKELL